MQIRIYYYTNKKFTPQSTRMINRVETTVVVLVIVAMLIVLMPRRYPVHRPPCAKEIRNRICVALIVPYLPPNSNNTQVVGSIERMLQKATAPSRISICVYDLGDSVKAHIPMHIQTFVKVARNMLITDPSHASDSDARAYITKNMFRDERYFMTVPSCAEVAKDWDSALIEMLPSPMSIITAKCEPFTSTVPFLALKEIQGSRLVLVNKPCIVKPIHPVPSLFWVPSLSFSTSEAIVASPPIGNGIVRNTFVDATLNGICLWTHGYDFFTPSETLVWKSDICIEMKWHPAQKTRPDAALAIIGTARTTRAYEAFAGVDLGRRVATARSFTGLTPTYGVTEALVKSGSVQSARIAISQPIEKHNDPATANGRIVARNARNASNSKLTRAVSARRAEK